MSKCMDRKAQYEDTTGGKGGIFNLFFDKIIQENIEKAHC
jgi:hypothetical protein